MFDKKIKCMILILFIIFFQSCYSLSYQDPENRQTVNYNNSQATQNTQSSDSTDLQNLKDTNENTSIKNTNDNQNNLTRNDYSIVPKSFISKVLIRLGEPQSYTVKKGDTVYSISKCFSLKWQDLLQYNNIEDPTKIKAGQKLMIPSQSFELYSPFETFSVELINEHRIKINGNKEYVYSLIDNGKIVFSGDVRGYGNSIIIQYKEYNIVLFGFDAMTVSKDNIINLNHCLGITQSNSIYMTIFQNEKIVSLKHYF